jgi:hypothetical protein
MIKALITYLMCYISVTNCIDIDRFNRLARANEKWAPEVAQIVMKRYQECSTVSTVGLTVVGGILTTLLVPVVAPLFAAKGLYGAAAISNGLATLGGGSLAAGGFGMAGGKMVIGVATSLLTKDMANPICREYSTNIETPIQGTIKLGEFIYKGQFVGKKINGHGTLNGYRVICRNNYCKWN